MVSSKNNAIFHLLIVSSLSKMMAGQEDEGEVVSLGTGDACILNSNLTVDGRIVMDCHAEVVARKALIKYDIVCWENYTVSEGSTNLSAVKYSSQCQICPLLFDIHCGFNDNYKLSTNKLSLINKLINNKL